MAEDDDPCAEAKELRAARKDLVLGKGVRRVQTGDEMVDFTRADLTALDRLLADAERRCAAAQGKRRRRRFAMGSRFRHH